MKRRPVKLRKRLPGWPQSAQFKAMARASILAFLARRHLLPKCNATAKSTGVRCGNLAMRNGKCAVHGGKTPSGAGWHKPLWPDKTSDNANAKLDRKLGDLERRQKRKARKLAMMTPEQRADHEAWQRSHKPGPVAPRQMRRKEIADAKSMALTPSRPSEPQEIEMEGMEIAARLTALRQQQAELQSSLNHPAQDLGVFG